MHTQFGIYSFLISLDPDPGAHLDRQLNIPTGRHSSIDSGSLDPTYTAFEANLQNTSFNVSVRKFVEELEA